MVNPTTGCHANDSFPSETADCQAMRYSRATTPPTDTPPTPPQIAACRRLQRAGRKPSWPMAAASRTRFPAATMATQKKPVTPAQNPLLASLNRSTPPSGEAGWALGAAGLTGWAAGVAGTGGTATTGASGSVTVIVPPDIRVHLFGRAEPRV